MVPNCAWSRAHIGLAAAPCDGGAGFTCACASTPSATTPSSAAQARIDLEQEAINFSGMSGHEGRLRAGPGGPKAAVGCRRFEVPTHFTASSHQERHIEGRRQREISQRPFVLQSSLHKVPRYITNFEKQARFHTCFSGQRHVVTGAPVWRLPA